MENEIEIKHDETNDIITFQARGEATFLEDITRMVLYEFHNSKHVTQSSHTKAYDTNKGYIGEEVEITKQDKNVPEFYLTGIKESNSEANRYKCRYICNKCGTKENKYLHKYTEYLYCRVCKERMSVTWVEDEYDTDSDEYNNFAFAGKFRPKIY